MSATYTNLVEMLAGSVEQYPDNTLFGTKEDGVWAWMTYAEFGREVAAARAGLASLGVERGDRVAVISDNRIEWAVGAYATYSLAAAYVPMYEAQHAKEWHYILNDSGAKVLIAANDEIRAKIDELSGDLDALEQVIVMGDVAGGDAITFSDLLDRGRTAPVDPVFPAEGEIAGFVYTSGTTGSPKGVLLSHGNFTSNVNAIHEVFPLEEEDRSASFLPWAHSFGQTVELHVLVSMGCSTGLTNARRLVNDLPEIQPTILVAVPTVFNRIYDGLIKRMDAAGGAQKAVFERAMASERNRIERHKTGSTTRWIELQHSIYDGLVFKKVRDAFGGRLKFAFSGGAAISTEVAEFISALGITVYEGYGLTETSPIVTANNRKARRVGSVGTPIPEVRVELDTDASGEEGIGEIIVHGPNVMQGYYNLPDQDAAVFTEDHGFRTGDLGSMDEEGFLFIRGRIKEQYKLENGKYVVPTPIEEQLSLSGYVESIMVYGEQRPYNIAIIVPDRLALTSWAQEQGIDTSDFSALLKNEEVQALFSAELKRYSDPIKGYERVRGFVLGADEWTPESGFLTPSLKVKRRAVLAAFGQEIEDVYAPASHG
jgi:long-chain acyl-CoA synthetase